MRKLFMELMYNSKEPCLVRSVTIYSEKERRIFRDALHAISVPTAAGFQSDRTGSTASPVTKNSKVIGMSVMPAMIRDVTMEQARVFVTTATGRVKCMFLVNRGWTLKALNFTVISSKMIAPSATIRAMTVIRAISELRAARRPSAQVGSMDTTRSMKITKTRPVSAISAMS